MPADLLPIGTVEGPIKLTLSLPAGWSTTTGGKVLDLDKAEAAVIMFAKDLTRRLAGQNAAVNISGDWNFSPEEAAEMADEIIREYSRVFGGRPAGSIEINILPFPLQVSHGTWQAETRGRAVTIVSGDMAFRTQSLQRLHEQLRHELFHIWMPNGVNLTGSYDWFYEGFALYQSLKTAVAVNRIGFTDMTATLSRAYAIDRRQRAGTSLLDSSRNRWAAGGTEVYARGMLVAFLTDIAMLERSGGKRSIQDLFRDIYGVHSTGDAMDGNEAVLGMMEKHPELKRIIEKYIRAGDAIDEVELLKAAGFELGPEGLKADAKPGGRQKTILDRLGYNNWRRSPKILK
jgi:predicted metalloprotease with PDZ domain